MLCQTSYLARALLSYTLCWAPNLTPLKWWRLPINARMLCVHCQLNLARHCMNIHEVLVWGYRWVYGCLYFVHQNYINFVFWLLMCKIMHWYLCDKFHISTLKVHGTIFQQLVLYHLKNHYSKDVNQNFS